MSEKLKTGFEYNVQHPETAAEQHANKLKQLAEAERQHGSQEQLSEIQKKVETHAVSGNETGVINHEKQPEPQMPASKDIKQLTYSRTLVRVRKHLNLPAKAFSSFIHQPAVDKVSEVTGKTLARPSGFLGGSIFALIGTSALLFLTRRYGYEFNYLVVLLTFAVGFLLGLLIELAFKALRRGQKY